LAGGGLVTAITFKAPASALESRRLLSPDQDPEDKLMLVQVVFRHGARTPLTAKYWPALVKSWDVCGSVYDPVPLKIVAEDGSERPVNDHNQQQIATKLPGNCHKGELTREGQHQARSLGRWLRSRYNEDALGLLPEEYKDGIVHNRTTNYSRTIATLQAVLTGLFPGNSRPILVHTTEAMDEILFANLESCQRLKQLVKDTSAAARTAAALPPPDVKALGEHVRDALGLPVDEPVNFLDVHDVMTSMQTHNKSIPEAMRDPSILKAVEELATKRFMAYVAPSGESGKKDEVLRLGIGRLMHLLLQRMEAAVQDGNQPRMYLYSGHDSTIMPLLAALGKEIDHWPVYCSNLTFELWKNAQDGQPYVRVLYNGEDLSLVQACGGPKCSLRQLKELVLAPYTLSKQQHDRECVLHFSHDKPAGEHVQEVSFGSSVEEED